MELREVIGATWSHYCELTLDVTLKLIPSSGPVLHVDW